MGKRGGGGLFETATVINGPGGTILHRVCPRCKETCEFGRNKFLKLHVQEKCDYVPDHVRPIVYPKFNLPGEVDRGVGVPWPADLPMPAAVAAAAADAAAGPSWAADAAGAAPILTPSAAAAGHVNTADTGGADAEGELWMDRCLLRNVPNLGTLKVQEGKMDAPDCFKRQPVQSADDLPSEMCVMHAPVLHPAHLPTHQQARRNIMFGMTPLQMTSAVPPVPTAPSLRPTGTTHVHLTGTAAAKPEAPTETETAEGHGRSAQQFKHRSWASTIQTKLDLQEVEVVDELGLQGQSASGMLLVQQQLYHPTHPTRLLQQQHPSVVMQQTLELPVPCIQQSQVPELWQQQPTICHHDAVMQSPDATCLLLLLDGGGDTEDAEKQRNSSRRIARQQQRAEEEKEDEQQQQQQQVQHDGASRGPTLGTTTSGTASKAVRNLRRRIKPTRRFGRGDN